MHPQLPPQSDSRHPKRLSETGAYARSGNPEGIETPFYNKFSLMRMVSSIISSLTFITVSAVVLAGLTTCTGSSDRKPGSEPGKIVVFIAGPGSHGYGFHEHRAGCMLMARLLEENTPDITTRVYSEGWPEDAEAFEGADAIVIFSDGGTEHFMLPHLDALNKYMERGVGLGVLHYALVVPAGEPGDYFKKWIGGFFETGWSVNPLWTGRFEELPVHEVTRGVKPFEIYDEWYYHMRFTDEEPGIVPILSALPPASTLDREDGPYSNNPWVREAVLERKEPQHLMWLFERTQMPGRGFGHTGVHLHWEWGHPDFRTSILNAIAWIAGADVPESGIVTPPLTLEELEANQDYQQPEGFDRDGLRNQLSEWQK
jgi:hypothetical protein